jgi:YHS domain-containing protein
MGGQVKTFKYRQVIGRTRFPGMQQGYLGRHYITFSTKCSLDALGFRPGDTIVASLTYLRGAFKLKVVRRPPGAPGWFYGYRGKEFYLCSSTTRRVFGLKAMPEVIYIKKQRGTP